MKKWTSLLLAAAVMLLLNAGWADNASAAKAVAATPKLVIDGKQFESKVPPENISGTVLAPIRLISENLGHKVHYDGKLKQVTVSNGSSPIVMTVGDKKATVGSDVHTLALAPKVVSGTTLVPVRFINEALGIRFYWDNSSKTLFVFTPDGGNVGVVDPEPEQPGAGEPGAETPGGETPGDGGTPPPVPADVAGLLHGIAYEPDKVLLKYEGTMAPAVMTLSKPDRIVVDLPVIDFAADFLPALPTDPALGKTGSIAVTDHAALTQVRYSFYNDKPRTVRVVLDLSKSWNYELTDDPATGTLTIALKEPQPSKAQFTVVLDAGHGGSDPGARSITGKWEKDFNLAVVLKVKALLANEPRINLVLTREGDTYPTLDDRVNLANSIKADLFLSVHGNSNNSSSINGTETYYYKDDSLAFANLLHANAVPATGFKDNKVRKVNFRVVTKTTMPAVLLEVGYLSHAANEKELFTEALQDRVAAAIVASFKQYLKLS